MPQEQPDFDSYWDTATPPDFDSYWDAGEPQGPGFVGTVKDVGRQVAQGLGRFGRSTMRQVAGVQDRMMSDIPGARHVLMPVPAVQDVLQRLPGDKSPARRLSDYLEQPGTPKPADAYYKPPETLPGAVASIATPIAAEGLKYIAGGGAIRSAAGIGARTAAPIVARGVRGAGQRIARGTGRATVDAMSVAPIDIVTAFSPEDTSAAAFAQLLSTEKGRELSDRIGFIPSVESLREWSEDPGKAALFEMTFGWSADMLLRGLAGTVAAPLRAAAGRIDVQPGAERGIREFAEGLGQTGRDVPLPEPAFVPEPGPVRAPRTIEPGTVEGLDEFSAARATTARDDALLDELRQGARLDELETRVPLPEPSRVLPGPDEAGGPLLRGGPQGAGGPPPAPLVPEPRPIDVRTLGGAPPEVTAALGRAGVGSVAGGAVGATIDEEDPLRGALLGAGVGATLAAGVPALARKAPTARPSYMQDPAVREVISTVGPEGGAPSTGVISRLTDKAGALKSKFITRIIDEAAPLKEAGRALEGSERLASEAARARGYKGAALSRLETNFQPVVDAARGHEEGIVALSKAERAIELLDAGLEKTDIDRATLEQTVQTLSAVPEVRAGVDALRAYYRSLLDHKLANGVISHEQYQAIVASGKAYIPFLRELEEGLSAGTVQFAPDGTLKSGATGIRRMGEEKASSRTVDPFRQAIDDTLEAERRVSKQRVTNMFAEIVDQNMEAAEAMGVRFVDSAVAGKRGARVTPVNVGGERRWMEIADDEIYQAFASFDPYVGNIFTRALSVPKTWLREGTTSLPDFAIANGIRDNVMAGIQYPFAGRAAATGATAGAAVGAVTAEEGERLEGAVKGGLSGLGMGAMAPHIARTLDAMRDIIGPKIGGDSAVYQEWLREGGGGFGFYPRDKKGAERLLKEMRKEGIDPSDIVSPRKWWDTLQTINRVVEEAPRVARFKYLKDQGQDVAAAIAGSRDISLDFGRIGAHTKGISAMTAFFNAQVQGWDKLARLLKNPKTWATGAATITAPSIGLWLINKDNPEYWDRPQWERNLFWLVPKGGDEKGFWRIPKPFEVGFIFGSIPERVLDYAYKKDPEALQFAMRDMLSQYGSGALPLPTGAEPVIENIADYSFFRGRPIDPKQFENLPPELQYDERTSTAAIAAGRAVGASPSKIENLVRGIGGSLAGEVLNVTTSLAKKLGLDDRPENLDRSIPLLRRFETSEVRWGERELALRRKINQGERVFNAVKEYAQNGETERAREYALDHMDELRRYQQLRTASRLLDNARQARQDIQQSDMDADEKREAIIMINERVSQVSEALTTATLPEGG